MSDEASIEERTPSDFIREQIYSDLKSGKYKQIVTRFLELLSLTKWIELEQTFLMLFSK